MKGKFAAEQINNIASARAASISYSNESARIPREKRSSTGVLPSNKPQKRAHNLHSIQLYCVLCKKSVMPERKYMSHSA